jgi:hypothetical protein
MRRAAWVATALLLAVPASGCESTQSKSARLKSEAKTELTAGKGVVVKKQNPKVKVLSTATLKDQNGEAVVVEMRNTGRKALTKLPISVRVSDARGKAVYTNSAPGLETSLAQIAALAPGKDAFWVNDQVVTTGKAAKARALVGSGGAAGHPLPRISLTEVHVENDPVSGISVTGRAINHSDLLQKKMPIFCVARRGDRVVAAGRAILEKLKPDKPTRFTVFFIGDPRGARLTLTPTPTVLGGSSS